MTTKTFDSLGLSPKTLKAVQKLNYTAPMPVQAEVIPLVLQGKDALVSAKTGSGKTAAFTIPLLDILNTKENTRCLIVAPTRELAEQIHKVFTELCQDHEQIKSALIVGGKHMGDQLKKLKKNPRFVIGTPGRLNDHLKRKSLDLSHAEYVVWDETDRMLDLGFIHQIEHIISFLPAKHQTLMFSATFPKRIVKLAEKYLKDPVRVAIDAVNTVSDTITQKKINIEGDNKLQELAALLKTMEGQVLVFAKTQKQVEQIAKALVFQGHDIMPIHGGQRQSKRDNTMKAFRAGEVRILVATDVAARGLDISGLPYVINYELPQSPEEYIHRIGRTGRANAKGTAISLLAKADANKWRQIQSFLKGKEREQSRYEKERELKILEANRVSGPFPVKKEERVSFKASGMPSFAKEKQAVKKAAEGASSAEGKTSKQSANNYKPSADNKKTNTNKGPSKTFKGGDSKGGKNFVKRKFGFRDGENPDTKKFDLKTEVKSERTSDIRFNKNSEGKFDKKADSRFGKRTEGKFNKRADSSFGKRTDGRFDKFDKKADSRFSKKTEGKFAKKDDARFEKKSSSSKPYSAGSKHNNKREDIKTDAAPYPFKKTFVGGSKKKYIKEEPKKYGNGPAKRWAKIKKKKGITSHFKIKDRRKKGR